MTEVTALLQAVRDGDHDKKAELLPLVYDELHRRAMILMQRERASHTLQPTVLVHDAYLSLVNQSKADWRCRAQFFALASRQMRRILVDHARARRAQKRGGDRTRVQLSEHLGLAVERDADVLALEDALKKLEAVDETQAAIVTLRFYGGLSVDEVAAVMDKSKRAIEAEWTMIKAWIRREMSDE